MRISTLPSPRMSKTAPVFCRNERREAKPATGFIKKQQKLQIPWTESSKNGENCKFRGRNHQKTAKTANSVGGIVKKRRKLQIPWAESSKIGENCVSPPWGKSKTAKNRVSPPWGKSESPKNRFSPPWGKVKIGKNCVSPRGKSKITQRRVPQNEDPDFAPADWLYIFLKTHSLKINNMAL